MDSLELIGPWAALLFVIAAAVTLFARRSSLGDSPWYWGCVFSLFAVATLFVMDGKYTRRQDHLENEYRYGTRTVEGPGAQPALSLPKGGQGLVTQEGTSESDVGSKGDAPQPPNSDLRPPTSDPRPPTPDRLISLWPLRIAAIGATLVSLAMLVRGRRTSCRSDMCTVSVDPQLKTTREPSGSDG
jgi:membrane protein implicated in regulation of membrane protease activity